MKTNLFKNAFIVCASFILLTAVFTGCTSNNSPTPVTADQTKLTALSDSCTALLANATGNYPAASITTFQTTLTSVKTAAAVAGITQSAVDNLVTQLRAAKVAFMATALAAIPAGSTTFALKFDEGSGTQLITTGNKAWTAVLMGGPIAGHTGLPTFVTGHKGTGYAMHFGLGSHLEISNFTPADLVKSQLSIAVWVKTDSIYNNNYIISYNTYHTWKFQLQEANNPFFTFASTAGILDADDHTGGSVINATWHHLVLSLDLTAGTETFYIDGANVWQWKKGLTNSDTDKTKILLSGTLVPPTVATPLEIGLDFPIGTPLPTSFSNISYFKGALDDLEFYNIALTDGQVAGLYNSEK